MIPAVPVYMTCGGVVVLLFFTNLVYFVLAGLFLFSIWSASLFFLPESYPALQLLSSMFIYQR